MEHVNLKTIHGGWFTAGEYNEGFTPSYRNTETTIVDTLKFIGYQLYDTKSVDRILRLYVPKPSTRDIELMSHYENEQKYGRNIRTPIKAGKLLKKLFPAVSEKQVEEFAVWYTNKYVLGIHNLTYKVSKAAEDFKFAYTKYAPSKGINFDFYNAYYKSSSDSCMKHKFDNLPCHPTEAYATGDFEIHYLVDEYNKVHARTVVCVYNKDGECFIPAPIYGSSKPACDLLRSKLKTTYKRSDTIAWEGASLKIIQQPAHKDDHYITFIGPYLDMRGYFDIKSKGYFTISPYVDMNTTPCSGGYFEVRASWLKSKGYEVEYNVPF
jgi:hypothetical protein